MPRDPPKAMEAWPGPQHVLGFSQQLKPARSVWTVHTGNMAKHVTEKGPCLRGLLVCEGSLFVSAARNQAVLDMERVNQLFSFVICTGAALPMTQRMC